MKIFRLKINSSVVVVNFGVILVALATLAIGWLTDNQELLASVLSPTQMLAVSAVQAAITLLLRTTHVSGNKPIEVLPKEEPK